jgi:hypothetical protein
MSQSGREQSDCGPKTGRSVRTAEFNIADLADVRQRVDLTPSRLSRPSAIGKSSQEFCFANAPRASLSCLDGCVLQSLEAAYVPLAKDSSANRRLRPVGTHHPRLPADYLPDVFAAAASNSCALTIALSAAALAQSASLGVASAYCLPISLQADIAASWTRFSSSVAPT